jgi:hypothetical protein
MYIIMLIMDYISTTELRKKSKELVETVKEGGAVYLVHRSEIIGEIKPYKKPTKKFNKEKFLEALSKFPKLPHLSVQDIDKRYRKELMNKYGKHVSGH